jgi:hypothetical protein
MIDQHDRLVETRTAGRYPSRARISLASAWAAPPSGQRFPNPETQPFDFTSADLVLKQHVAPAPDQPRKNANAQSQKSNGGDLDNHFKKPPQKAVAIFALRPARGSKIYC